MAPEAGGGGGSEDLRPARPRRRRLPHRLKWSFTRPLPVAQKYVICNADEGEPGTIKDRYIMEGDPTRSWKAWPSPALRWAPIRASSTSGANTTSPRPVESGHRAGPGQGVSGREALRHRLLLRYRSPLRLRLLHLRRGNRAHRIHRGQARLSRMKPPFPGVAGLWHKPTIVNNVESLASVRPSWPKAGPGTRPGHQDTTGTKIYQIIGHIKTPQIVEVPAGLTLRELIDITAAASRTAASSKCARPAAPRPGLSLPRPWTPPSTTAPWPRWAGPWVPAPCW